MPKRYKRSVLTAAQGIKKYIDQNPGNGITTAALASEAGISRNVLQAIFRERFGNAVGEYRFRLRMEHATNYLKSGKSIKEISIILQYSSPSSFSNAFKKHFQVSPSDWAHTNVKSKPIPNGNKQ